MVFFAYVAACDPLAKAAAVDLFQLMKKEALVVALSAVPDAPEVPLPQVDLLPRALSSAATSAALCTVLVGLSVLVVAPTTPEPGEVLVAMVRLTGVKPVVAPSSAHLQIRTSLGRSTHMIGEHAWSSRGALAADSHSRP